MVDCWMEMPISSSVAVKDWTLFNHGWIFIMEINAFAPHASATRHARGSNDAWHVSVLAYKVGLRLLTTTVLIVFLATTSLLYSLGFKLPGSPGALRAALELGPSGR